jgi:hypothetical protein
VILDFNRALKTGVAARDAVLRGLWPCPPAAVDAAPAEEPRALAGGPLLVSQHPLEQGPWTE